MQTPQYKPTAFALKFQRRVVIALLVALLAGLTAYLSWPFVQRTLLLRGLRHADPVVRLRALNQLLPHARENPELHQQVVAALLELAIAPQTRAPAVRMIVWAVKSDVALRERITAAASAADDSLFIILADALRAANAWNPQDIPSALQCRLAVARITAARGTDRAAATAALVELGPPAAPCVRGAILSGLDHDSPDVRRAAVLAAAVCLREPALMTAARADPDETVRVMAGRCLAVLDPQALPAQPADEDVLAELKSTSGPARLSAIIAARRLASNDHTAVVLALRDIVEEGLRVGAYPQVGAALEGLAALGDEAFLQVMLDAAERFTDQPVFRVVAARAATRLDVPAGSAAVIHLFAQDDHVARDLAILALADLPADAVRESLVLELFNLDGRARGAAALALMLIAPECTVDGLPLPALLERRLSLERDNPLAETEWLPRGYYICALVAGGAAREDIGIFELNENFPRGALFIARMHAGDPWPLEVIMSPAYDAVGRVRLLRNDRAGEIVAHYLPSAPTVSWWHSPEECLEQVEQLRVWWLIRKWDGVLGRRPLTE